MLDIGASELLLTVIVAIVVIGPKDLPRALRMAGGWIAKVRRVSGHFRSGIEEMIRQAELEEMQKEWLQRNEVIMKDAAAERPAGSAETGLLDHSVSEAELAHGGSPPAKVLPENVGAQPGVTSPELPLEPSASKP